MARVSVPLKDPIKAAVLAWVFPGLGHIYQGRVGKGILYCVCILGLFVFGLALGDWKIVYWKWLWPHLNPEDFRFSYVCQFFVGLPALPGLIQATLKAFHLGPILGGFMDVPAQEVVNGLHPRLSKLVEIGVVYTEVAGLLNILAIYDAYDGPAFRDEEPEPEAVPKAQQAVGAAPAWSSVEGR